MTGPSSFDVQRTSSCDAALVRKSGAWTLGTSFVTCTSPPNRGQSPGADGSAAIAGTHTASAAMQKTPARGPLLTLRHYRAGSGRRRANNERMHAGPAIERFLASPGLGEATRRAYRFDLEPFAAWLEKRGAALDDVDARLFSD